jgi:branched-subunit amino acid transport protein
MNAKKVLTFVVVGAIVALIFSIIVYKNIRYTNEGTVKV